MSRIVVVVPFAVKELDPDAHDLAGYLAADAAAELARAVDTRLLADAIPIAVASLGAAAAQLGADAALGARLRLEQEQVHLEVLLADAAGAEKALWTESSPLGAAPQLGRMLARATLLALGEDSSAAPQSLEPQVPAEAVLRLCRAVRRTSGDVGEVDAAVGELLALLDELPALEAPRRAIRANARAAAGTDRMPAFLSALEQLAEARPDDAETLLELAGYRALHLDVAGARELYLRARDVAEDALTGAQASVRLAELAEQAGRIDEAVAQLRTAARLADDPQVYARLGALLLPRDPGEGLRELTRATVLAPDDPALLLQLVRALREHGGDPARAVAAAAQAARLAESRPDLADEIATELQLLLKG